jgi:hypothetical protein
VAKDKQEWISTAFVGVGLAGLGLFGALAAASASLGALAIPVWAIAAAIVGATVRSPVAKAFAERLSGRVGQDPQLMVPDEVYAELDELRARLLELEERHDFTERLLAARQKQDEEQVS